MNDYRETLLCEIHFLSSSHLSATHSKALRHHRFHTPRRGSGGSQDRRCMNMLSGSRASKPATRDRSFIPQPRSRVEMTGQQTISANEVSPPIIRILRKFSSYFLLFVCTGSTATQTLRAVPHRFRRSPTLPCRHTVTMYGYVFFRKKGGKTRSQERKRTGRTTAR